MAHGGSRRRVWWVAGSAAAVVVLAIGAVAVIGVREATADPGTGMLRLAHLSPATPAVDMYAQGPDLPLTKVAGEVSYRTVSPYLTEPAGTYRVQGRPAGAPQSSPPLFDVAVDVPAGSAQTATFVDIGPNGATQAQVLDDETAPAAAGSGALRIVQAAAEVGPVDVTGSSPGSPDVPIARTLFYGSATPYATVPAQPWTLQVRSRSGKSAELEVPVTSTSVATLVVTRGADGGLATQLVPDAASAASVPTPAPGAPPVVPSQAPRTAESSVPPVAPGTPAPPQPSSAETAPEASTPPAPVAPSPPTGGIGAGLGGLSRSGLLHGGLAAGGIWDTIAGWFGADDADGVDSVPAAVKMPLSLATAPPPGGPHPTSLDIPSIGLDSSDPVDLRVDYRGALQVPTDFSKVGWFTSSAVPGDPGPAVMVGHVDTRRGPAVFGALDDLRPGAEITVDRSDGGTARFRVDSIETFPKDGLPTERVYGPSTASTLRLLTCGGPFDDASLNYRDNIVVFASKVG
ncbi:class F sortase [Actinomycetospora atypica]|uniref:Class F sortase n=1 Tax=Actinomycetospora atypica TaxID=1290095 RepID=A0ABV9YI43_9PSEU